MNWSTSNMREIAEHLTAYEAAENKPSETDAPAVFSVCEKLRVPLAQFAGTNGFRSLLLRAVALAGEEVRWLREVRVNADGSLERPAVIAGLDEQEITEGEVALVAKLLDLLVAFIGEPLTLSLVREVWPGAPLSDLNSDMKHPTKEAA